MHLKQLKLSGFKSFVEPSVIPFPSQLVAIVGPNGCGKSNIIDAVRWVMGESSAKNLRGESMTDVIFNGSSQRKSIGQASVELVFDNSLGRLSGQYASYQEVAVKRVVTRDGDSTYFLNGVRCRRRDISDLFSGTGAGSRGYAIIGQDMITRLIEARPDELRVYLEEAAGIAKYKERRRETLVHIRHTRENLERVADVRAELDKHLSRLERQASAAKRYKILQQQAQQCQEDLLALKWQVFFDEKTLVQQELQQLLVMKEQQAALISHCIKEKSACQVQWHAADEQLQQIQTQYHQLATEIARMEAHRQQNHREKDQLQLDEAQIKSDWQTAFSQKQQQQEALQISIQQCQALQAQLTQTKQVLDDMAGEAHALLQQETNWNAQWQQAQTNLNQTQQQIQVLQLQEDHITQRRSDRLLRLETIERECHAIRMDHLSAEVETTKIAYEQHACDYEQSAANYQDLMVKIQKQHDLLNEATEIFQEKQATVQTLVTQHAALVAVQKTALQNPGTANSSASWQMYPRLAETMTVDEPWSGAFEMVLGDLLQAVVVDSLEQVLPILEQTSATISIVTRQPSKPSGSLPCLADKVLSVVPSVPWPLRHILLAQDLAQGLSLLPQLDLTYSIVTQDGYWLGHGWIKSMKPNEEDVAHGLLTRQQAIIKLECALRHANDELSQAQATVDKVQGVLSELVGKELLLKEQMSLSRDTMKSLESQLQAQQHWFEQSKSRCHQLEDEKENLQDALEMLAAELLEIAVNREKKQQALTEYQQVVVLLNEDKSRWEAHALVCRQQQETGRLQQQALYSQIEKEQLKQQQLTDAIDREQARCILLEERLEALQLRMERLETDYAQQQTVLQQAIAQYQTIEQALFEQREQVSMLMRQREQLESDMKTQERAMQQLQERLQQGSLQTQALDIKAQALLEALAAFDMTPDLVFNRMQEEMEIVVCEQTLRDIEEKIQRLGAINLAAVEEYDTEFQRKQHLDEQYQDLTEALLTLESAIAKMDKETQLRLQETFEQINLAFQQLFPRLFGGGRAFLQLTCDNLLEAGIMVMAQPPGKRNSSIHLLSGGEKALTAVALVFAIFQLNPSPFCLLDEVDAPLDDANVRRFCDMVREMSEIVQFLFITHNKVTMELAEHLIGVTMREPGVSRIVTVDVEEALSIAE